MVEIRIDNKIVFPEESFSCEFVKTNGVFMKESDYTLEIKFSLSVYDNLMVFGHLNRLNCESYKTGRFVEIRSKGRLFFKGYEYITDVNGDYVSIQVVGSHSGMDDERTANKLRDIDLGDVPQYEDMDDVNLGQFPEQMGCFAPVYIKGEYQGDDSLENVQLRWDDGVWHRNDYFRGGNEIANYPNFLLNAKMVGEKFLFLPYIREVIRRVIEYLGLKIGFDTLSLSKHAEMANNIFIVHAYLSETKFAKLLPDWTIDRFIDEVERFFCVVFVKRDGFVDILDKDNFYSRSENVVYIDKNNILKGDEAPEVEYQVQNDNKMNFLKVRYDFPQNSWYIVQDIRSSVKRMMTEIREEDSEDKDAFVYFKSKTLHPIDMGWSEKEKKIPFFTQQRLGEWERDDDEDGMKIGICPAEVRGVELHHWRTAQDVRYVVCNVVCAYNGNPEGIIKEGFYETLKSEGDKFKHDKMYVAVKKVLKPYKYFTDIESMDVYNDLVQGFVSVVVENANVITDNYDADLSPSNMLNRFYKLRLTYDESKEYKIKFLHKEFPNPRAMFVIGERRFLCKQIKMNVNNGKESGYYTGIFYACT